MTSFRSAVLLAALLGSAVSALPAAANPPPWAHAGGRHADDRAQDAGVISGTVVAVDYGEGLLVLQTPRGRVPVTVLPSTSIFMGRRGYATLADVGRGRHVEVYVSQSAGRLFAQIIRIR